VADVYGDGRVFADGVLAREDVESSPHLYLGEQPLLPSVPSRLVTGDDDELDDLVVKPRGEMGGEGVVVWRDADDETRERVRREIAAEPGGWIGQQLIRLSVHPTVVDGRLEPRHVDLRPFALLSDAGVRVLPAATTRVALERGSLVVNSAQGGGMKDTWVPGPY